MIRITSSYQATRRLTAQRLCAASLHSCLDAEQMYNKWKWINELQTRGLRLTDRCLNSRDVSTVVGVVNKLNRRPVLLTTQSTCRGKIVQIQSLGQSSRGKCRSALEATSIATGYVGRLVHARPALCIQPF